MRTNEERVEELHRRMAALRQEKARRRYRLTCAGACAAGIAAAVLLALGIGQIPPTSSGTVSGGAAGSFFAGSEALTYIAIAVIAFGLGVLVTLFCLRVKRPMKEEERHDD